MRITTCVFALTALVFVGPALADDRWYDANFGAGLQAGNADWNTAYDFFSSTADGSSHVFWTNTGHHAIFDPSGSSLVTVGGTVSVSTITFNGTGYTVTGTTLTLTGPTITTNNFATINAPLGGSVGLTKEGSSALILGATNTYTGTTTVNAGTLALSTNASANNIANSSVISVASGALLDVNGITGGLALGGSQTLRGDGAVNGAMSAQIGATIAPGSSAGQLTFAGGGDISLDDGSNVEIELGANTTPGTTYDQIVVDHGAAKVFTPGNATLKLIGISGVTTGVSYTIIDATNAASIATGSFFRNVGGALLDTEGFTYTQGGMSFTIDYDASFVSVNFSAVPEPGFGLLVIGGIALSLRRTGRGRTA